MMFDFERPTQRDFTETIKTLSGLCRFIIADITNRKIEPVRPASDDTRLDDPVRAPQSVGGCSSNRKGA
jgi:hypothetical protein